MMDKGFNEKRKKQRTNMLEMVEDASVRTPLES